MAAVTVKINGIEYNLKGKDDEEYLNYIANYVDEKVKEILSKNNKLSSLAATVLVAINISDELFKVNNDYNELLDNFERVQNENNKLKDNLVDFQRENEEEKEKSQALADEFEKLLAEKALLEEEKQELLEDLNIKETELKELEEIKEVQIENNNLKEQITELELAAKKLINENNTLKTLNKEIKFDLQSSRYKVLDLEKKYLESQIKLATEVKNRKPYLKPKDNI